MTTFEERLAAHRQAALLPEVGLTRYQHVERLGNEEVDGLLDGEVVVQTKIDGTNLTVAWYDEPVGLVIASRNNVVYRNGERVKFPVVDKEGNPKLDENGQPRFETRFDDAVDYVLAHDGIKTMASLGFILRGEWLIQHSTVYDKEKYSHFYLFDVQWRTGAYVPIDQWSGSADEHGVRYIPVLARYNRPSMEMLVELTKGPDEFGAKQKEGVVVKRYDFSNKYGRMTWGKLVSADFTEKMHAAMGAINDDPVEIRFVARVVTYEFIMKTIGTIEQDVVARKLTIRDMPQVLGRVWHDAFTEELWDFVKKENVGKMDFRAAQRLAVQKTRDVALAYFNDVPVVWEHR